MEVARLCIEHIVGVEKDKVVAFVAFEEDATLAWRSKVTQCVVVSLDAFWQIVVLVEMMECIDIYIRSGSSVLIDGPCFHIDRNYFLTVLVALCGVRP